MASTTSPTVDRNRVNGHASALGLGSVRPWLIAIGAGIVVLMAMRRTASSREAVQTQRPPG